MLGKGKRTFTKLAAVLAVAVALTGCSSGNGNGSSEAANSGAGSTNSKAAAEHSGSAQKVKLRIEVYERGEAPAGVTVTDNYWTDYVQQNFGDPNNIEVEYVPVPRSEDVKMLNVMMASGEAPDIVFTYDENLVYSYAQQGGLQELGELLDQHGSNLQQFLGEDTLAYGVFDGKQYAIPAKRVNVGKYASFIRQDWLEELNLPMPETTEQVYETLKAFKEQKPGKSGDQIIPLGFSLTPSSYEPIIWGFTELVNEEERITLTHQLGSRDYPTLLPGHKEALRFLNQLYHEGLMSPDFALDKDEKQLNQDIQTGKVGMFGADGLEPLTRGVYENLQANEQNAVLAAIDPYTNSTGQRHKPLYKPAGMYIMIPKASDRAVEAIKYLDWMAQEDVMFTMQNGEEGVTYELKEGIPVRLDSEEAKNRMFNTGDMVIISNGTDFGDEAKNMKANLLGLPEAYRELGQRALEMTMVDGVSPVRFEKPLESQIEYGTLLQEKYDELVARTILAAPDQFDAVYDDMVAEMMKNGGDAILQERQELYAAMKQ